MLLAGTFGEDAEPGALWDVAVAFVLVVGGTFLAVVILTTLLLAALVGVVRGVQRLWR